MEVKPSLKVRKLTDIEIAVLRALQEVEELMITFEDDHFAYGPGDRCYPLENSPCWVSMSCLGDDDIVYPSLSAALDIE